MIFKKFTYGKVNSTNDLALKLIKTTRYKSGFITASSQVKGRGRHGNVWISKKGNLFVTIFFSLKTIDYSIKKLSTINLNIIKKLLSMYTKEKIFIKKPNDIMINKKKICGILQEIISKNGKDYFIVGIGLNVNNKPKINKYPTACLREIINKKIKIKDISNDLFNLYNIFLKKGMV
jgi:BirA family biotin operon repressor/biotin-[acetyl-CoA-carboxylase] ligase